MRGPHPSRPTTTTTVVAMGVALASAAWHSADAIDALHNAAWPSGSDCIDHAWESDAVYTYRCHGETNQQWDLTADGELRSVWGKCLEYFDDQDKVAAVPCDLYRRQKWFATGNGLIKPQGFRLSNGDWSMRVGFCLDATQPNGNLGLFGCHGDKNQQFSASFLPSIAEDVVQVDGTWAKNQNCIDYDYSNNVATVYACHGQWNQRWHFTSDDEFRIGDTKCMEYDARDQVVVRDCSKAENQKWVVLDDGHVQPKAMPTKCLDAAYATSKLALAACMADKPNQKFRSSVLKPKNRDLLKVKGPWPDAQTCVDYAWGTDVAYVYGCHGQANQLWEFTNDEQIRTTENKCLEFDGEALLRVAVKPCDSQRATQKWRPKATGEIVPRGYFDSKNVWRMPIKCLDASLEDQKLQLWDCVESALNQKFRSNAMPTRNRDFVFADGASSTAGANCVRGVDTFVVVAKCSATREMLWEFKADGTLAVDVDGTLCLTASGGGVSGKLELATCTGGASQKWERTASGAIALQAGAAGWGKCLDWKSLPTLSLVACGTTGSPATMQKFSSTIFTSVSSGKLNTLYEKATVLSETIKTDMFLTSNVLASATDVVEEAARILTSGDASDVARATEFLQQFISKNDNVTDLSVQPEALYATSSSEEFLLSLSILLQSTDEDATPVIQAIAPAIKTFSEQLFEARYDVLLDHVLRGDVNRVEAYSDGSLSDFNEVGGMLSAVCGMLTKSAAATDAATSMCRLASYFTLIDQFFQLKYRLLGEGARGLSETSLVMARTVVETFKTNQALLTDPLWRQLMTVFVLGGPYVDVLPSATLSRASRGDAYLPTFVLYSALGNDKFLEELTPMVRFVSDQITSYHVTNVLKLTSSKDIDGLDAYMAEPLNTYSMLSNSSSSSSSDFAMVALYVVPLVCGDPARQALSLCQLEQVYTGLQSVLSFERARRSSVVSLEDVLEVDVRKKLDVIDQEKKQFEMISTLQEVANKIGTTILNGMADLKTQIATSTAAIRSDIEAARKDLRTAIGTLGVELQTSIEQSTDKVLNEVSQQAASIRQDIADSSQRLEQRLDDTGRAILGSIEESKQELKYQIGAQAEQTRSLINQKSDELKDHMSKETQGLREFVDAKTNEVIGVVREEGASTREVVNQATSQIIRVVQEEGAITRTFVDTKTNEIKEVVKVEGAKTRELVDLKTNQVISTVKEEGQATRAFVDKKGDQVIGVVKEEGEKTRTEVRSEGAKTRERIDIKAEEVKKVVKEDGAKTRADVNKRAAELKKEIKKSSEEVKTQVKKSQKAITDVTTKQLKAINSNILAVNQNVQATVGAIANSGDLAAIAATATTDDCKDDMWTANSNFARAFGLYKNAMKSLKADFDKPPLRDDSMSASEYYGYLNQKPLEIVPSVFLYIRSLMYLLQFNLEGASGPSWLTIKNRPVAFPQEYNQLTSLVRKLQNSPNGDVISQYADVLKGSGVDIITARWEELRLSIQLPSASTWGSVSRQIQKACDTLGPTNDYYVGCVQVFQGEFKNTYDDVYNKLSNALDALEELREAYREGATKRYKCKVATATQANQPQPTQRFRHLASLAVMASNPNEPFYAMTYSSLAKVLLDYRMQEAADQFCKYYEFRNGGVAPPMCGDTQATPRPYNSLATIQQMRSWQPTVYPRFMTRVLLPTQPAQQASTGREYPFVDLGMLAQGRPVTFEVPTWDLDWLKRYRWVLPNAKNDTVPTYYVESFRLYLPFEAATAPTSSEGPFGVTAFADSSTRQFASWRQRDRVFALPAQQFKYDVVYDEPYCLSANKATNPYHEAAECVATADRSSQLCLRPSLADTSQRLLPNLLSTWQFRADFDLDNTRVRLVQPLTSGTNGSTRPVEMTLFADVTLVEVASSVPRTSSSIIASDGRSEAASVTTACCASGEYRNVQSGACSKCPDGSVAVLKGYTCGAKQL